MTTLDTIHQLANERLTLYRKAGNGGLHPTEVQRIQDITGELAVLWDTHRREIAGDKRVRNSEYVIASKAA